MENISDDDFKKIVRQSKTMAQAAKNLGMAYTSFVRKAKALGIYSPNQGGKGLNKSFKNKIQTAEILKGKYPEYSTYKLKLRLLKEGHFRDQCSICGWKEKPIGSELTPCELDHIDGNSENHKLDNLRILCPNCHSLTRTYRFRRGKTNFEQLGKKILNESAGVVEW